MMLRGMVATAVVGAGLAFAAPAHGQPGEDNDKAFLHRISDYVVVVDAPAAIFNAHLVCDQLGAGVDPNSLADDIAAAQEGGMSDRAASQFVVDSTDFYCPEYDLRIDQEVPDALPKQQFLA